VENGLKEEKGEKKMRESEGIRGNLNITVRYSTVQYRTVQYSTVQDTPSYDSPLGQGR
jgi:hypothetical protein